VRVCNEYHDLCFVSVLSDSDFVFGIHVRGEEPPMFEILALVTWGSRSWPSRLGYIIFNKERRPASAPSITAPGTPLLRTLW
jgi:hypothetical protein